MLTIREAKEMLQKAAKRPLNESDSISEDIIYVIESLNNRLSSLEREMQELKAKRMSRF